MIVIRRSPARTVALLSWALPAGARYITRSSWQGDRTEGTTTNSGDGMNQRTYAQSPSVPPSTTIDMASIHRMSNLWVPTVLDDPSQTTTNCHRLLLQSGVVHQNGQGLFSFLPVGLRIMTKIERIIDEELGKLGCQKLAMPYMSPVSLWASSGRSESLGKETFRVQDRKHQTYILNPTHEEVVCELVNSGLKSYRQLPLRVYQTGRKYRDEMRGRGGMLRAREFHMNDLYTFDVSPEAAAETYGEVMQAYHAIFSRLGVDHLVAEASNGSMGGRGSHEFHIVSDVGEDHVLWCNKCNYAANVEVASSIGRLDMTPGAAVKAMEGVEGLGSSSSAMTDDDGSTDATELPVTSSEIKAKGTQVMQQYHNKEHVRPTELGAHPDHATSGSSQQPTVDLETLELTGPILHKMNEYVFGNPMVLASAPLAKGYLYVGSPKKKTKAVDRAVSKGREPGVAVLAVVGPDTVVNVTKLEQRFPGVVDLKPIRASDVHVLEALLSTVKTESTQDQQRQQQEGTSVKANVSESTNKALREECLQALKNHFFVNLSPPSNTVPPSDKAMDILGKVSAMDRNVVASSNTDIATAASGDRCASCCAGTLQDAQCIEVGHTFYLADTYTNPMKIVYQDQKGKLATPVMGCYGIGVSRLVAAVAEVNHDDQGLMWPVAMAPYTVAVVPLGSKKNGTLDRLRVGGFEVASELLSKIPTLAGEVIVDDRDATPGFKLKDAALMGHPLVVVLGNDFSHENPAERKVEVQNRRTGQVSHHRLDTLPSVVGHLLAEQGVLQTASAMAL
eukprot:Clim_evm105s11 gene=Clim_evmTU105s11